jgi:hypothetical protein
MIQDVERKIYQNLLLDFKDVFAWSNADLSGIAAQYGEHWIDLKERAVLTQQR